MRILIGLLDDELLPTSKQKATQEFKDLTAGDDDKLADVLLNFDNVGKRCGKTEAEVIEAFVDLLRKLCEGEDYSMWFCAHVAERYVNQAHTFTDATALYASLRDDLTAKRLLRECCRPFAITPSGLTANCETTGRHALARLLNGRAQDAALTATVELESTDALDLRLSAYAVVRVTQERFASLLGRQTSQCVVPLTQGLGALQRGDLVGFETSEQSPLL